MNPSSTRRSASRASSVSSGSSTSVSRRRKPHQTSNSTLRNSSANSSTSSAQTLRRLHSKSRKVKWIDSNDNNNSIDTDSNNESVNHQQNQNLPNDQSLAVNSQHDNMTPSAMISSLSLSRPTINNNNTTTTDINDITINSDSPVISDDEENVGCVINDINAPVLNPQKKNKM